MEATASLVNLSSITNYGELRAVIQYRAGGGVRAGFENSVALAILKNFTDISVTSFAGIGTDDATDFSVKNFPPGKKKKF